jgi:hypothetical protein
MPGRKLLFVLFSDRVCQLHHALLYALDLTERGHTVQLIVEGEAIAATVRMDDGESRFSVLFRAARERGLVLGACRTAAGGCANEDPAARVSDVLAERGIPLLDGLDGHAGVGEYVDAGYELVVF